MTNKFNVGDRVRVNHPGSLAHGRETVVTETGAREWAICEGYYVGYRVDIPMGRYRNKKCIGTHCVFEAHELIPIYDGNEKVSWSSCVWQPNQVRA